MKRLHLLILGGILLTGTLLDYPLFVTDASLMNEK